MSFGSQMTIHGLPLGGHLETLGLGGNFGVVWHFVRFNLRMMACNAESPCTVIRAPYLYT